MDTYGPIRNHTEPYGNPVICVKIIGFLILNNFIMLVRFSKYDFWIPEHILGFNGFFIENQKMFSCLIDTKDWTVYLPM